MYEFLEPEERVMSLVESGYPLREFPLWEGLDQWLPEMEEV